MDNRGECLFLANCMDKSLTVSRPYSKAKYDFIVDNGLALARVQVKSAHRWKTSNTEKWNFNVRTLSKGSKRAYQPGEIDFLALHLVEIGLWYIVPADEIKGRKSIYINPSEGKGFYEDFRERWGLITTFCPSIPPR